MTDYCVALTATGSAKEARTIADVLVDEGLVACVNIISGVESVYFWQGKRCREKGWLLVMMTRKERIVALKQRLPQLHGGPNPPLVFLSIEDGLPAYLEGMKSNS